MLEMMLDKKIIFLLLGIVTAIGVISKLVVNVILKRLVSAAGNMSKSNHSLMRLVRAKFEHACMVSDKVVNVRVFVDKYLYEYRVAGLKIHSWRRLEKAAAWMCVLIGAAGAALEYTLNGMQEMVIRSGATGAVLAILVYLFHLTTDEGYRLEGVQTYMVDYLENVCLHKYEKPVPKETKELKVMAPEVPVPDFGVVSDKAIEEEEKEQQNNQKEKEKTPVPDALQPGKTLQEMPVPDIAPEVVIPPVKQKQEEVPTLREQIQTIVQEKKSEKSKEEVKKDVLIRQILEEFMA